MGTEHTKGERNGKAVVCQTAGEEKGFLSRADRNERIRQADFRARARLAAIQKHERGEML
jgi:hypothetical protein